MSTDNALAYINQKKWYVSGASQNDKFEWSVSLRPYGDWSLVHGSGKTLEKAILKAFSEIKNVKKEKDWKRIAEEGNKTKALKTRTRLKSTRRRKSNA